MNREPFAASLLLCALLALEPAAAAAAPTAPATGTAATLAPTSAPSFTGHWLLDVPASELGKGRKPPRSREDQVTLTGGWVDVHSHTIRASGDTLLLEYRYRTDGEAVNKLKGQDMKTRGSRDGAALRFESTANVFMVKLTVVERWVLSSDGATFTIERDSDSPLGKEHQRLLFRRGAGL